MGSLKKNLIFLAVMALTLPCLVAAPPVLSAPELTAPEDGDRLISIHPHLDWKEVSGADTYDIEVSSDSSFSKKIDRDKLNAVIDWYVIDKALSPGKYFWRVRAVGVGGKAGPWSSVRNFTIFDPKYKVTLKPGISCEKLQAAVDKAKANSPARIIFERGRYHFNKGPEDKLDNSVFTLSGASDIIFDFNGSTIVLDDPADFFFRMNNCQRITLRDYKFTRDPDISANGTITAVDKANNSFDLKIAAGYDKHIFPREVNQFFIWRADPDDHKKLHNEGPPAVFLDQSRNQKLGERHHRFFAKKGFEHGMKRLAPGDFIQMEYRRWPFAIPDSIDDLIISNGSGSGHLLGFNGCTDVKVLNSKYHSEDDLPSGGGFLLQNNRRGPWIENCFFGLSGDDCHDLAANAVVVTKVHEPKKIRIDRTHAPVYWKSGDELLFFDPRLGQSLGTVKLESITPLTGDHRAYELTISKPVDGIAPGKNGHKNTQIYNLSVQQSQTVYRNNKCQYALRFGLNMRAIRGLVENNTFYKCGSSAIYMESETGGYEGVVNRHVVIQNNTFRDVNFGFSPRHHNRAVVHSKIVALEDGSYAGPGSKWMGNRDLLIRNNRFINWHTMGIRISSTNGAVIENNSFESSPGAIFIWPENRVYFVDNSKNVVIRNNDLSKEKRSVDKYKINWKKIK